MTLSERISAADPEEVFYIGAANGSGFVFIGNRERFEKDIADVSKKNLDYFIDNLKKDIRCLKRFRKEFHLCLSENEEEGEIAEEKLDEIKRECADVKKSLQSYITSSYVKWVSIALAGALDNIDRLKRACDRYPRDRKNAETFIPFDVREIKEEYPRILGGTALLVEGCENGKFWLQEEYESGHAENDEEEIIECDQNL